MNYNFWFIVGSQFLYGNEVLQTVEQRAKEMAEELSKHLPYLHRCNAPLSAECSDRRCIPHRKQYGSQE